MSYTQSKNSKTGEPEIIIAGWENGISDNPYAGLGDMRNVDNTTIPGEASVAMKTQASQSQGAITNVAFTVDSGVSTSVFTYNGTVPLEVNTAIIFTGADLPAGLTSATTAYYIKTTPTPTTFTVSAVCAGGATKTFSDSGSGVMTFSTIQMGTPNYFANSPVLVSTTLYNYYFLVDSNGRCWIYDDSSTGLGNTDKWIYMHNQTDESSLETGNGLVVYKDYLFWFTSDAISVISIVNFATSAPSLAYLTTYASWLIDWKSTTKTSGQVLNIGDAFQGGLVGYILKAGDTGYVADGNQRGYIVSAGAVDSTTYVWHGDLTSSVAGTSADLGTGQANTTLINAAYTPEDNAALAASNYYVDALDGNRYSAWYLPSKDELAALMANRTILGMTDVVIWSSTEKDAGQAWAQSNTTVGGVDKTEAHAVFAIHDFVNIITTYPTTSTISHQAMVAVNDDAMYFCNGMFVGSLFTALQILDVPPTASNGKIFNLATTHRTSTGVTTASSTTVTTTEDFFTASDVGAVLFAVTTGNMIIPTGAYIVSITDSMTATISAAALRTTSSTQFRITAGNTFNAQALRLPSNDYANCLAELGTNLLVGGVNNYIYPWDRTSVSYSNVIFLSENYVQRMVTVNTTTYLFIGHKGRIYQTNGTNVSYLWEIPDHLSNTVNPYFTWTDAIFNRNQLYFGFTVTTNSGTTINQYGGLWTLDVKTGKGHLQNILSYATYSGYVSALSTARGTTIVNTTPSGDGYGLFIGWNSGSVGGVDKSISTPYSSTEPYIISDMIPVGQYYTKKTFNNIEYKLSAPLVTGESVTIDYRSNINEAFTNMPITEGGTVGEISGVAKNNGQNLQWIQLKITLISTTSSPSYVRLQKVVIR